MIKGVEPLVGAAAVRELTGAAPMVPGEPRYEKARAAVEEVLPGWFPPRATLPTVADVENDGDRGPRPIDQATGAPRAQYVQHLMSAVAGLSVDEVRALAWVAWQLPGRKLRRKCEEATATGWCGSDLAANALAGRSTPEDRTRAALLAAWRQVVALVHGARSSAAEDLRQRTREDVLADEAARRAGGAK